MSAKAVTMLRTLGGQLVPLTEVSAIGRLEGALFELCVTQHYRNSSTQNLEAVFTFPVPLNAVLLGFELEINGGKHVAVARARAEATQRYEQAIDTGDAAALLEHNGHGLYTVSLGNLRPGHSALIRYRYAELLQAFEGYLRVRVPTTIAPRYGDPSKANLQGPSVPGSDLLVEYAFNIRIDLAHLGQGASVRSPSHGIEVCPGDGGWVVQLVRKGYLDRDFVLEIAQASVVREALVARDFDHYVLLAPLFVPADSSRRPLVLKILLDCSGSMAGNNISSAKSALLSLLDELDGQDSVSLTCFGSAVQDVTEGLEPADRNTVKPLKALVRQIEANLGGTEMASALKHCLSIERPAHLATDLLLITDGAIQDLAQLVEIAATSGHRLFVIGIGVAPVEALARLLAERTGGACEFIGKEGEAESAILRVFKRLRAVPRVIGQVQWPASPLWVAPMPRAVFPGDTVHVMAGFAQRPEGPISIELLDARAMLSSLQVPIAETLTAGDALPRIAACRRLGSLAATEAAALALQYQLVSTYTSFVVVAEQSKDRPLMQPPTTVAVEHMLPTIPLTSMVPRSALEDIKSGRGILDPLEENGFLDMPAFLRRESTAKAACPIFTDAERERLLRSLVAGFANGSPLPTTLAQLCAKHPVPESVRAALERLAADERPRLDELLLRVFLALLAELSASGDEDPAFMSAVEGPILGDRAYRRLRRKVREEILGL